MNDFMTPWLVIKYSRKKYEYCMDLDQISSNQSYFCEFYDPATSAYIY